MHARFRLPRYRSSTPTARGAYGYGCRLEGGELVCELVSVHKRTRPGTAITAQLYEAGRKTPRRVRVIWPGLEPGTHREVHIAIKTEPATARA